MSHDPFSLKSYGAFLFDMDGTLISSTVAAERVWAAWARRHGLDVAAFLPTIHGVRGIDNISRLALPPDRWAIVTSAPLKLAKARLAAAGLTPPAVFVTAEDVTIGKPDPQGYRLGARRLGVAPEECLVFEDVMAGVLAGEGAGADVMVITETHHAPLETRHRSIVDYQGLSVRQNRDGGLTLRGGAHG